MCVFWLKDKYCDDNGRVAVDPVILFKYLFLKVHTRLSDADLVKRAVTDLAFKYFLDMTPEEMPISSSLLSVFRRQRLKDSDLLDKLIEKTVSIALEKGIIERKTEIVVDSTHTVSKYAHQHPNDALKALTKRLRMLVYSADAHLKQHGLDRTESYGIEAMTIQTAMGVFYQNVRYMMKNWK